MAGITDIFTPSFAFSLAICLLLTGLIAVYFTQKIAEQNHKMTSMLELVSTLANEVNMMRGHIFSQSQMVGGGLQQFPVKLNDANTNANTNASELEASNIKLISVSDGESDDNDESGDDDDEDDDNDDDDNDDDEDDDESDTGGNDDDTVCKYNNIDDVDSDVEDVEEILQSFAPKLISIKNDDLNVLNFEELCIVEETDIDALETCVPDSLEQHVDSSVKNIDVVLDYKKASLGKLKSVVVEKGLIDEKGAAKLKKPELLKLLEDYL
jgi:hypothetical protein